MRRPLSLSLISIASALILAGCSSNSRESGEPLRVAVEEPVKVHPPAPAPLKLEQPVWSICGDKVCMSVDDAKKINRNAVAVGRWMGQAGAALTYYRGSDAQVPPAR